MKIKKSNIGVTHIYCSPVLPQYLALNILKKIANFFLKFVAIPFTIGVLLLTDIPIWFKKEDKENLVFFLILTILFLEIIVTILLKDNFRNRTNKRQEYDLGSTLHSINHNSRDAVCYLIEETSNNSTYKCPPFYLEKTANTLCNELQSFFQILTNDPTIGCAIRIGVEDREGNLKYVTIGRSSKLNPSREKTSIGLKRSEGIPHLFEIKNRGNKGVLFYDNIELASKNNAYIKGENDKRYKKDIKSMIVAPINGWNGYKYDLIGLLHLTSQTTKILDDRLVDIIQSNGDLLALTYTSMFSKIIDQNKTMQAILEK